MPNLPGTGTPPLTFVATPAEEKSRGLVGMMTEAGLSDPSNSDMPQPGGLLGLMQDYLRK
ncbi:hypothetical protein QA635_15055 [Bradyrhizobium brasilense]|uniref:hypothetical protein n=1 Tax=Bradyrhizobium brasilense TaxID=1419277 RepID=UPI0024B26BE6|nr:hypothetical protein [Bradyrhizobium australafricanum]WFU35646.1 hypothetical protein QA635_15055 [Bradyrhizobium australafricanum]